MAASYTANAAKWFTAKLDEDGKTLVFSVPAAVQETAVGETAAEYDDNRSVIVVEAKDSQDKLAVHLLVVGNNRAPRDQETLPNNFRIGVQPDTVRGDDGELIMALAALDDSGGVWEDFRCTHYNTCEFKLAGFFMDDEGDSNLTFSAKAKKPSEAKHLSFTSIDGGIGGLDAVKRRLRVPIVLHQDDSARTRCPENVCEDRTGTVRRLPPSGDATTAA